MVKGKIWVWHSVSDVTKGHVFKTTISVLIMPISVMIPSSPPSRGAELVINGAGGPMWVKAVGIFSLTRHGRYAWRYNFRKALPKMRYVNRFVEKLE